MTGSWKWYGAVSGILGGVLFVILTFTSMLIYPGGYSFLANYFSELGLTQVAGQPNTVNYVLFSAACTSAAVCSVPFWLSIHTVFTKPNSVKYLGYVGTVLGLAAAPFLSALAILAGDIFPLEHGMSTILFFLLYASAIVIYSVAILLNKNYNQWFALVGIIVAAICLLHIFLIGTAWMQKLAVYGLVLWSAFQGYALLKIFH
ncbi:MAG: hypothetical protein WED05_08980 [Candidatus Atabeyarchaeum deiterrae]